MVEESAKFGTTVAPFETTELLLPVEPVAQAGLVTETARVEPVRVPPVSAPVQPPPAIARPPLAPAAAKPPAAPPVPATQPVQPAPAARVPLTTPPTIPPQRNGIEPSRDGATPRIPLVTPTAQPEKTNLCQLERVGPRFREFQPPAGLPFLPRYRHPLRLHRLHRHPWRLRLPVRLGFHFNCPRMPRPKSRPNNLNQLQPSPARVPLSVPGPAAPKAVPVAATPSQPTGQQVVTLPLRPILQSLPPMQVAGDVESVPAEAKISFQISAIAPQLASGKVVIPPKDFHAALPEQYRSFVPPRCSRSASAALVA